MSYLFYFIPRDKEVVLSFFQVHNSNHISQLTKLGDRLGSWACAIQHSAFLIQIGITVGTSLVNYELTVKVPSFPTLTIVACQVN